VSEAAGSAAALVRARETWSAAPDGPKPSIMRHPRIICKRYPARRWNAACTFAPNGATIDLVFAMPGRRNSSSLVEVFTAAAAAGFRRV